MAPFSEAQAAERQRSAADAFEVPPRAVGCAAGLLPRAKSFSAWWTGTPSSPSARDSDSTAGGDRVWARLPLKIENSSGSASTLVEEVLEEVKTLHGESSATEEPWELMGRRFRVAHNLLPVTLRREWMDGA